jgi:hypothetical protein
MVAERVDNRESESNEQEEADDEEEELRQLLQEGDEESEREEEEEEGSDEDKDSSFHAKNVKKVRNHLALSLFFFTKIVESFLQPPQTKLLLGNEEQEKREERIKILLQRQKERQLQLSLGLGEGCAVSKAELASLIRFGANAVLETGKRHFL